MINGNNAEQKLINDKIGHKVIRTAAQTAVLMALLTLISKLLGFVREMIMAAFFGTSYITDAYVMAQAVPGIIFAGIFGAVGTAYMPMLAEKIEKQGDEAGNRFTSQAINIVLVVSLCASIIGLVFSDQVTAIFASGFEGETAKLTSFFIKVTFSYTLFSAVQGILDSFLQYKRTFLPQIIIGYAQNIIMIAVIILSAVTSHYFLVFGLLFAYIVKLILYVPLVWKRGMKYHASMKGAKNTIKQISLLAVPVFIGSSISQINIFVDKTLASGLAEGSVSALNYASLLNNLVMGLTISILTVIIYPRLAQANSLNDHHKFSEMSQKGFTIIFMIALPFSLGAMCYSGQIVQIVYERGAFDPMATAMTGTAYLFYAGGLLFMALNEYMVRIYYSMHNMRTPMTFGCVCVIINIVLNLILVRSMAHNGLALATSIAAFSNTTMLFWDLRRKYNHLTLLPSIKKLIKIIVAAGISVGLSYLVYALMTNLIWMPRMIYLAVVVLLAMVIYIFLLKRFGIEDINILKTLIIRKNDADMK